MPCIDKYFSKQTLKGWEKAQTYNAMKRTEIKLRLPNRVIEQFAMWAEAKGSTVTSLIEALCEEKIKSEQVHSKLLQEKANKEKDKTTALTNWIEDT